MQNIVTENSYLGIEVWGTQQRLGRGGVAERVTKGHEDFRDNRYIHYLSFADILWVYI